MPDKKERLDNIKNILENYEKNDNLNDTLKFIKRKFEEELEDYKYCENINNLEKGNHIKYVDLFFKEVKYGTIVDILKNEGRIKLFVLKNLHSGLVWNINPSKYFLYYKTNNDNVNSQLRKLMDEYIKNFKV